MEYTGEARERVGSRSMTTCSICYDDNEPDRMVQLSGCGHNFHLNCLLAWAQSNHENHGRCPMCRSQLSTDTAVDQTSLLSECPVGLWEICNDKRLFKEAVGRIKESNLTENDNRRLSRLLRNLHRREITIKRSRERLRNIRRVHKSALNKFAQAKRYNDHLNYEMRASRRSLLSIFPLSITTITRTHQQL